LGYLSDFFRRTWPRRGEHRRAQGYLSGYLGFIADSHRTPKRRWGRKDLIVWGMWVQAAGLFITAAISHFVWWMAGSVLLGIGTAMVYPTLLAAISGASHPTWRARSLSIYRFWRDMGYAVGALLAGMIGDAFGLAWAIAAIGVLTFLSGMVTMILMHETITTKKIE
jgi:MFS family permease